MAGDISRVLIIGAGPAGLTAALELQKAGMMPLVVEKSGDVGGLSKTIVYKGNRIDIGGHRFFSKSDRVMEWWAHILPQEQSGESTVSYHGQSRAVMGGSADPATTDAVMLVRSRLSRILYGRKFYSYPVSLSYNTIRNLGLVRMAKIGMSYIFAVLFPIRPEVTLEDFFINRFGRELYGSFFKDYTEKVWGEPCSAIPADWGGQRVKGLSIGKALLNAVDVRKYFKRDIRQKKTETSLIERFLYPKLGPGLMWETVARLVESRGGTIVRHCTVVRAEMEGGRIAALVGRHSDGTEERFVGDYVLSSMPIAELASALGAAMPAGPRALAEALRYRDFITVGVLVRRISPRIAPAGTIPDNWIYIQEPDVKVGRLQVFNNWSPYLVADPDTVWLGMEYFASEGDALWTLPMEEMRALALGELGKLGFAEPGDILDSVVIHMEKAYPAYMGESYARFDEIRAYFDSIPNLFLIGRNGMHRYNNQDHSMLTAMEAVRAIVSGTASKEALWAVNTEQDYHEEKAKE